MVSKSKQRFKLEQVETVEPFGTKFRTAYLIMDTYAVDRDRQEWARCFEKKRAAIACALLNAWEAFDEHRPNPVEPKPLACPHCGGYESAVLDSRKTDNGLIRRRKCSACGAHYKTREIALEVTTPGEDV